MVKICIVGGGPSGIITGRLCLEAGHDVTIFEQEAALGGIWLYSEATDHHSAMYDVLKTNTPKHFMAYPGYPYPKECPTFLSRQMVLQYLQKIANSLPFKFNTKVLNIVNVNRKWLVETEHFEKRDKTYFDVIFVCNGHHFKPLETHDFSQFKGKYLHSRDYRCMEPFRGKRVALVGAGFSGIDLALQLAPIAAECFLIGEHANYPVVPKEITQLQSSLKEVKDHSLILRNGFELQEIDMIIECRGYQWNFPFFDESLVSVKAGGRMVSPLWLYCVHRTFPTRLFFIGLNDQTMLWRTMLQQVQLGLNLISGKVKVPPLAEMEAWEQARLQYLKSVGKGANWFHVLDPEQFEYIQELCEKGGIQRHFDDTAIQKLDILLAHLRQTEPASYKNSDISWDGKEYHFIRHKL